MISIISEAAWRWIDARNLYKVISVDGCLVRSGAEKTSKMQHTLPPGDIIAVSDMVRLDSGVQRFFFTRPDLKGWVSANKEDGTPLLELLAETVLRPQHVYFWPKPEAYLGLMYDLQKREAEQAWRHKAMKQARQPTRRKQLSFMSARKCAPRMSIGGPAPRRQLQQMWPATA